MSSSKARTLQVIYHSRTGLAAQMSAAIASGARGATLISSGESRSSIPLHVQRLRCERVSSQMLCAAAGFVFCAPENLASLSGEMKSFFDRTYYDMMPDEDEVHQDVVLQQLEGEPLLARKPYGAAIAAGSDGSTAARQIARIAQGWRLSKVMPEDAVIIRNQLAQTKRNILLSPKPLLTTADRVACEDLGALVASRILLTEEVD
ncbi:unnamed protein product [Amoebophrya sp. A25]|nr:unnamed protein product [Amoebophrya sp. A25]|eukprot:GSA25T00027279001.1